MDLAGIERRYGLGRRFAEEWRNQWGTDLTELTRTRHDSIRHLWADFGLTTNLRGVDLAYGVARRLTIGWPGLRGVRVIDVGCGLGGTPVACSKLGAEAVGIDVDDARIRLAEANARDNDVTARFQTGDLLDPDLRKRLGRFDAVTGEDVLEHVDDARKGVMALAELADEGGLVMTTIPNGHAVSFVRADAHYLLPGLTLIDERETAAAYFNSRFDWGRYEVADYHGFDDYEEWFGEAGLTIHDVEHISPTALADLEHDLAEAERLVDGARRDDSLPVAVRDGLAAGWETYRQRVSEFRGLPSHQAERRLTAQFWRIYASNGPISRRFAIWGPARSVKTALRRAARRVPGAKAVARAVRRS